MSTKVMTMPIVDPIHMLDPSEIVRPESVYASKPITAFRDYSEDDTDPLKARVKKTYYTMHTNMSMDFVKGRITEWTRFDHAEATIMEALQQLNTLIDESDPDADLPNIVHAFQTAERIRQEHPDKDWFHITGLIHDLGKVMALWGEPQWAVVGDTFPMGCAFSDNIVYGRKSFIDNPDLLNPNYSTELGIYSRNIGLENVLMSWGHDEYLYRVLKNHGSTLPDEALYAIRFHSFYPWHAAEGYQHLCNEKDMKMVKWVKEFNKFDLYTKSSQVPDIPSLLPYYQSLIDKYIPGIVKW